MFNGVNKGQEMSETTMSNKSEQDEPVLAIKPILGRADHRLDPKRRFTIPSDWFERMGKPAQVYAMPSLSRMRCLDVFCPSEFDKRMETFRSTALSDSATSRFTSRIGELINCVSVDSQNRIRIKDSLLSYAGLGEDVVLIGAGFHFEVWSLDDRPKIDGNEADILEQLANEASTFKF